MQGDDIIVSKQVYLRLTLNYKEEVSDEDWEIVKEMLEMEMKLNWKRGHLDMGRNELESIRLSVTYRLIEMK